MTVSPTARQSPSRRRYPGTTIRRAKDSPSVSMGALHAGNVLQCSVSLGCDDAMMMMMMKTMVMMVMMMVILIHHRHHDEPDDRGHDANCGVRLCRRRSCRRTVAGGTDLTAGQSRALGTSASTRPAPMAASTLRTSKVAPRLAGHLIQFWPGLSSRVP